MIVVIGTTVIEWIGSTPNLSIMVVVQMSINCSVCRFDAINVPSYNNSVIKWKTISKVVLSSLTPNIDVVM